MHSVARIGSAGFALLVVLTTSTGCTDSTTLAAQKSAELACSESRVDIADLLIRDVDSLDTRTLQALADQANDRAEAAREAMNGDSRWNVLAEATMIISDYASAMAERSRRGQPPSQALDLSAWDTYKLASNAYGHECRIARDRESTTSPEED